MDEWQSTYANRIANGSLHPVPLEQVHLLPCYRDEPERYPAEMEIMLDFCRATGICTLLFTESGHWFLPEEAARQFPAYFEYTKGAPKLGYTDSVIIAVGEARGEIVEQHGWMALQKGPNNYPLHYAYADDPPPGPLFAVEMPATDIRKLTYGKAVHWEQRERDFMRGALKDVPLKGDFMQPYWAYAARAVESHDHTAYHLKRAAFLPLNAREAELLQVHQLNAYDGIDVPDYYRLGGGGAPEAFAGMSNCIQFVIDLLHRVVDTGRHNLYHDLGIQDDQLRRVKLMHSAMEWTQVRHSSEHVAVGEKGYAALSDCRLLGRRATLIHTAAMNGANITEYDLLPHLRQRALHIGLPETAHRQLPAHLDPHQQWVERIAVQELNLMPVLIGASVRM